MADNRRDILSNLATVVDITEVTTVVRSYVAVDILNYKEAELPLINIIEPAEDTDQDMTSHRQIMSLEVALRVWFVSWAEIPTGTYETLVKEIRDAIGANFNLDDALDAVWIDSISIVEGELPVYHFDMSLLTRYYLDAQNT